MERNQIIKLTITSNNICYGPCPEPDDEVEQKLTIEKSGNVFLSRYAFGDGRDEDENYKLISLEQYKVDAEKIAAVFDAVYANFYGDYEPEFITDVGDWVMDVMSEDAESDEFHGPLIVLDNSNIDTGGLSDLIRWATDIDDLLVFDGNPDRVDYVEVTYNRTTKIVPEEKPEDVAWEYVTWDYKDILTINRKSETLEIKNRIGEGCIITHTYYVQGGVENFLDGVYPESFKEVEGNPSDVIVDPMETKNYEIKLITKHGKEIQINGTYDKKGLPTEWPEFIEDLQDFIEFYGFPGEMFSERCYGEIRPREGEFIFCKCIFEENNKSYYYIADTNDYREGDYVVVPAGEDNHQAVVKIALVEYTKAEDVPFSVDKAKHIIGHFEPKNDVDLYR